MLITKTKTPILNCVWADNNFTFPDNYYNSIRLQHLTVKRCTNTKTYCYNNKSKNIHTLAVLFLSSSIVFPGTSCFVLSPCFDCFEWLSPLDADNDCFEWLSPLDADNDCFEWLSPLDADNDCFEWLSPLDADNDCFEWLSPLDADNDCFEWLSPPDADNDFLLSALLFVSSSLLSSFDSLIFPVPVSLLHKFSFEATLHFEIKLEQLVFAPRLVTFPSVFDFFEAFG